MEKEELKIVCCAFFRWWYNQPGNNTEQGFDKWYDEEYKNERKELDYRIKVLERNLNLEMDPFAQISIEKELNDLKSKLHDNEEHGSKRSD